MESKYFFVIIAILLAFVEADKYLSEKPSFLSPCSLRDPGLNRCMATNFQSIFSQWKDGLPGLSSLGKLDPLQVKRIKIVQDNSRALALNMELQNVLISGASKIVVQDIKLDTRTWTIYTKIFVPRLDFDSDYKVKGHVLALPLNGNGRAKFAAEKAVLSVQISLKLRDDGHNTFTEIENLKANIDSLENFNIHVDNLFNGQRDLEESANKVFNDNWPDLYESLRPGIVQTIERLLDDRLKKIFHYVPANYFIGDIPKAAEVYG